MTFIERLAPAAWTGATRRRDELAFLPAALEIVETPPSPTGRAISASIVAAFCIALIWPPSDASISSRPPPARSSPTGAPR
jgi:hemolysin D